MPDLSREKMILVTTDAYSKWIDAQVVTTVTASVTIEHLRTLFSTHGLPEVLVSDNDTQFMSTEFEEFVRKNGTYLTCSSITIPSLIQWDGGQSG